MNSEYERLIALNADDLLEYQIDSLEKQASDAIAWGTPDNESTGYSPSEFISIIRKQQQLIRLLYGRLSSRGR